VKRAIAKHMKDFIALVALVAISLAIGGYILTKQRLTLPGWVPGIGTEFTEYKAAMSTAQSVTPGQGQTVQIAGVDVGEISKVDLVNGRAIVSMKLEPEHEIYRDASALLRPRTGLNDMVLQLTPGTRRAGEAREGYTIPVDQTLANVNLDEILASLDRDTRTSLQLLLGDAGRALDGQGRPLSNTLRRFEPLGRDLAKLNDQLSRRSASIRRSIGNFRRLAEALGAKDDDIAALVDSSNAVFRRFANQDRSLRATLRELPSTLRVTSSALRRADELGGALGRTLGAIRPGARALGPSLRALRPFLRETTPIIRDQLRPFARDVQPFARTARSSSKGLTEVTPDLTTSLKLVNRLVNELAYNPRGSEEGYLFWLAWGAHLGTSIFNMQDAHGPLRRAVVVADCEALGTAKAVAGGRGALAVISSLSATPDPAQVCPQQSGGHR